MAKIVNICDVCNEIFAGGDAPKGRISQKRTEDYSVPIYSNGEENSGLYGFTDIARVSEPSITVSARGTIGYTAIRTEPFVPIVRLITLVPRHNDIDIKYLYYAVQNYKFTGTGTSIPQLTVPMLKQYSFPLPDKGVQQSITRVLDKVSNLISLRKQQLTKMDELVKARFVEMFDGKGYPEITIGELVANKVSSVKKVFAPTDTIKYIDISSIDNKRNVMTGYIEYVLEEAPSRAQQHIKKGDIVVSTVRPNLKNVAITGYEYDNLVASSGFCVLRAEKCLPTYLMAVVCSNDFTDAMTKVVTGANYPAIKDSDVRSYVVPNPPIEVQEQFAAFVEQVDKSKLAVQQSLDNLELLKKALMQKYFG